MSSTVMSATPATAPAPATEPSPPDHASPEQAGPKKTHWKKYFTPILVLLLAVAVLVTITRNWNSWEGAHVEQITDDAYVRGDLTPLSTKVAGIVATVVVSDYQHVHKGDLLAQLEDSDYKAQVQQASAAVDAAMAAIANNHRQRELQDARIERALAGIDQAHAQIPGAQFWNVRRSFEL